MMKIFFTMRVIKSRSRLPREVGDAPSLEIFKVGRGSEQPDLAEAVSAHCGGVGLDDL